MRITKSKIKCNPAPLEMNCLNGASNSEEKKYQQRKSLTGFTLIEFLIYVTLLSLAVTAIGIVAQNVFQAGARTDAIEEVAYNGRFSMQKIRQAVSEASAIEITNDNILILAGLEDADRDPVKIYLEDHALKIQEGEKAPVNLTTSKAMVEQVRFQELFLANTSLLRAEINISTFNPQGLPEYDYSNLFISSFLLGD